MPIQWYIVGGLSLIFALLIFEIDRLRTRNRKIENALEKSEEKFSKAFWKSPLSVTVLSARHGRYIDVNETFEWATGWRRQEVIGRSPFDIGLWADPEASLAIGEFLLTGNLVRDLEVRARTKSGE